MITPVTNIFVYGTLRRGGSNHFRMADADYLAAGTVRGRLYGIDWYPGLVLDASGEPITGEVYQISPGLLESLDDFEGNEYRRVRADVACGGDHRSPLSVWVWEWLGPVDEARRITNGDWLSPQQSAEPRNRARLVPGFPDEAPPA